MRRRTPARPLAILGAAAMLLLIPAPPAASAPQASPAPNGTSSPPAAPVPPETAASPQADGVSLEARLDRDRAAVGEPITMTVTARHAGRLAWEGRSVSEKAGSFDIEQVFGPAEPPPDPNRKSAAAPETGGAPGPAGTHVTQWVFRVVSFEIGKTEIPPLALHYVPEGGGELRSVETKSMKVEIVATITNPDEKPADIRSGFGLPRDLRGWLWLGAALLALGLAILLLRRWWKGRKKRPVEAPAAPPKPLRPAYDRYLEALEALLRSGLLESGRLKEFHVEIAEIVKRYLGEVLGFDAIDRTTWETMHDLQSVAATPAIRSEAGAFLNECDLVKFAKHLPDGSAIDATVRRARAILDLARRQGAPAAAPGASSTAMGGAP